MEAEEYLNLPAETQWEPRLALFTSSLDETYRVAISQSIPALKPRGYLVMEFGFGQSDRLKTVVAEISNLHFLEIRNDHRDIARVIVLQKS